MVGKGRQKGWERNKPLTYQAFIAEILVVVPAPLLTGVGVFTD
jgi:hypothetical protein